VTVEISSDKPLTLGIRIFSVKGDEIFTLENVEVKGLFKKQLNLNPIPQGTYIVEIGMGTSRVVRQLVIAK
jgi:hypothetical protein